MSRANVLEQISRRIGDRGLVYFGTRGDDIVGVSDLPQLSAAYSVISAYEQQAQVTGLSLEQLSRVRVDLDEHDIDLDTDKASVGKLRTRILQELTSPTVVFTYRPSHFLSSICFARAGSAEYLGMFKDHQWAFEHKPWVEQSMAGIDVPHVNWKYVADEDSDLVLPLLRSGPVVLRRSHSSGGRGLALASTPDELREHWPTEDEAFVSVAPFISDAVPVNVGGVVWDRDVTVHYPSVQLIGIPGLTAIPFGFCGSDFAAAQDLAVGVIDEIEESTRRIGAWMRDHGFRGAFGVDFLVVDDRAFFMEVNPRFQGSTNLSCRLSRQMNESCLMTDHLAALLHLSPGHRAPLSTRMEACPPAAQFVQHLTGPSRAGVSGYTYAGALRQLDGYVRADVLASARRFTDSGASVARITMSRAITIDGYSLDSDLQTAVKQAHAAMDEKRQEVSVT